MARQYLVEVDFAHSQTHADLFLADEYPESIRNQILPYRMKDPIPIRTVFEGSETIATVRALVIEKLSIPPALLLGMEMSSWKLYSLREADRTLTPKVAESTTIESIGTILDRPTPSLFTSGPLADEPREPEPLSGSEEAPITLNIRTTAGRLNEIIGIQQRIPGNFFSDTDGIVSAVTAYRHYCSALTYLEGVLAKQSDASSKEALENKKAGALSDKREKAAEIAAMLNDWDRYVLRKDASFDPDNITESQIEQAFEEYLEARSGILKERISAFCERSGVVKDPPVEEPSWPFQAQEDLEQQIQFTFPASQGVHTSHSFRLADGTIDQSLASFEIRSGVMLWGQLQTVFAGSMVSEFQGNANTVTQPLEGGTILQRVLKYRCAARKGTWKVRRFYGQQYPYNDEATSRFGGWVISHEDVQPMDVLQRCSRVTPDGANHPNMNEHVDKDVLYVNRYDWAEHCWPGKTMAEFDERYKGFLDSATGRSLPPQPDLNTLETWEEKSQVQQVQDVYDMGRRHRAVLLALDADEFGPDFMKPFMQDFHPMTQEFNERTFRHGENTYGSLTSMSNYENELGYFVFSGEKHRDFPEADELVAIVYDATYSALESHRYSVETSSG